MTEEVGTRIALLEREIINFSSFFSKLDGTIEKLAEVSSSIKELLSVHELRINQQSQYNDYLADLIEKRREQSEAQHLSISTKILESEKDLRQDMDTFQKAVLEEMKEIRKEIREYHEEAVKNSKALDKIKILISVGGGLIGFILFKMGILPSIPF